MDSKLDAALPGHPSFVARSCGGSLGRIPVSERRHLCASLASVNALLAPDGDDQRRTLQQREGLNVLDDWCLVPLLQEWRLDGVALGVDTEENQSQMLNVAVGGVCRQVVDVFGGRRAPLEELYVGLVATLDVDKKWYTFEYVPFGETLLLGPLATGDGRARSDGGASHPLLRREIGLEVDGSTARACVRLEMLVGAWRLGRVTDTASVHDPRTLRQPDVPGLAVPVHAHNVSAAVAVEWMDWRALLRRHPDSKVAANHLRVNHKLPRKRVLYNFPHEEMEQSSDPRKPVKAYRPDELYESDDPDESD